MTDVPERELDELYSVPAERFTEARKQLVRKLQDAGRKEEAAYVRSLRKPTRAASAINRAVHAKPQQATDLIAASRELRRAHARALEKGGGDRRFLQDATAQQRAAVSAIADTAREILERDGGSASADLLRRIEETLDAVALDETVMELFVRGKLEKEARAAGLSLPVEGSGSAAEGAPLAGRKRRREARAPDTERQRRHVARLREAERALNRARRAVETKERALRRANAERDRADAALEEADRDLRAAQAALDQAERKVASARAKTQ